MCLATRRACVSQVACSCAGCASLASYVLLQAVVLAGLPAWRSFAFLRELPERFVASACSASNLEDLCALCADPAATVVPQIKLGRPFHVMKANNFNVRAKGKQAKSTSSTGTAEQQARTMLAAVHEAAPDSDFVVECKFDGWRVTTHIGDIDDASSIKCARVT